MLPKGGGDPPGDPPELGRFKAFFLILGLGARDPQVPTWRGSRRGYEVPPGGPTITP